MVLKRVNSSLCHRVGRPQGHVSRWSGEIRQKMSQAFNHTVFSLMAVNIADIRDLEYIYTHIKQYWSFVKK